jgi:hypothetical protein
MPATLYARDSDISPQNLSNPSLCAKNRLNLLPEHLAEIGSAFIHQLTLAPLTSLSLRVLTAIYDQTIGYDKREDDMNGECLKLLTGIRNDHANKAVRRLEALNIILTHRGKYGKWMSINFDFPNWGKPRSESTSNDPSCLLSAIYQSPLPDEEVEFSLHTPHQSKEKESAKIISKAAETTVVSAPKTPEESSPAPVKTAPSSIQKPQPAPTKPALPSTQKPQPDPDKPALPSIQKPQPDSAKLHFPDTFPETLRQQIIDHLAPLNLPQPAQRLLDYFVKCLDSGKVRNPMAYFNGLKNRWLKGKLDLNDDQPATVSAESDEKKRQQQQKIKHLNAYQEAIYDIKQLQRVIKRFSDEKHCTFEEALKKIHYNAIWEAAVACLKKTKKAYFSLDMGQQGSLR